MNITETEQFKSFFDHVQSLVSKGNFAHVEQILHYSEGPKYIKFSVISRIDGVDEKSGSVYCFLDKEGNIYKPASWRAPAKHARGNIFNDDNGKNAVTQYGVVYLR